METSNWIVIKKVIELGNLTDASVELNISQSGISYIIKKIETEIGFPIFIRHRKGMSLTTIGKTLLPFIDNLLNSEESLKKALLSITSLATGSLTIGSYKSISKSWLPIILESFIEKYPNVKINIEQGSSESLEKKLHSNAVDLAFTSYRDRADFTWIDLKSDQLLIVLPANHPLVKKEEIPFSSLADLKFIGSSSDYEYDVNRILRENHISNDHISLSTNDEETIIQLVKKELGIGILFESYLEHYPAEEIGIEVKKTEPNLYRRLGIAVRTSNLDIPIIEHFILNSKNLIK